QITGPEPPTTLFVSTFAVAVNQFNGEVLIAGGERVEEMAGTSARFVDVFRPGALTGQYEFVGELTGTPNGPFGGVSGIATDAATGNVFVAGEGEVDEFSVSGAYLGRITGVQTPAGSFHLRSVAVDPVTHRVFVGDHVFPSSDEHGHEHGVVDVF